MSLRRVCGSFVETREAIAAVGQTALQMLRVDCSLKFGILFSVAAEIDYLHTLARRLLRERALTFLEICDHVAHVASCLLAQLGQLLGCQFTDHGGVLAH
jgi:hypothetical protein